MPPKKVKRGTPGEDPYPQYQAQVSNKISSLNEDFEKWKYILEKKNTANTSEFQELTRKLRLNIAEITREITAINTTINAVEEKRRGRFAHITDEELHSRKSFVTNVRTTISSITNYLDSDRVKNKIKADEQRLNMGPVVLKPGQSGDQYVAHRRNQYTSMDDESDAVLEDMAAALDRLHAGAKVVNVKLHEQKEIVSDMDDNMSNTQNLMDTALTKMDAVLNKSTKAKWAILAFEF